MKRAFAAAYAAVLIAYPLLLASLFFFPPEREYVLKSPVPEPGGFLHTWEPPLLPAPLSWVYALPADTDGLNVSTLRLYEDGSPLGPAHVPHGEVRKYGEGRYSHWESILYFSSSDGSSPASNGKHYSATVRYTVTAAAALAFSLLWIIGLISFFKKQGQKTTRVAGWACVSLGIALGGLLLLGKAHNFGYIPSPATAAPPVATDALVKELYKTNAESYEEYAVRLTSSVHEHMTHYFAAPEDVRSLAEAVSLSVLVTENPLFYGYSILKYLQGQPLALEILEPEAALRRGYGFCSQFALVVASILERQNIPARIYTVEGHVLAGMRAPDGKEYTLDADIGVVFPYSLAELERLPEEEARRAYYPALVRFFTKYQNQIALWLPEIAQTASGQEAVTKAAELMAAAHASSIASREDNRVWRGSAEFGQTAVHAVYDKTGRIKHLTALIPLLIGGWLLYLGYSRKSAWHHLTVIAGAAALFGIFILLIPLEKHWHIGPAKELRAGVWEADAPVLKAPLSYVYAIYPDSSGNRAGSTLAVSENGVPLGPPHLHPRWSSIRGGGFAHWGDRIFFSTTDNAPPSGRVYTASLTLTPKTSVYVAVYASLFVFLVLLLRKRLYPYDGFSAKGMMRLTGAGALALGLLLLCASLLGLFGNRNYVPDKRKAPIPADVRPILAAMQQQPGEDEAAYLERLTREIHTRTAHYFASHENPVPWEVRSRTALPFTDNYLVFLYALGKHLFGAPWSIEFTDPVPALRRGYGYCSQRAMLAVSVLEKQGFSARMVGLAGHVVATAALKDGKEFILDPDYGVIMPYSLHEIERAPDLLDTFYTADLAKLKAYYQSSGDNYITPLADYANPRHARLYKKAEKWKWRLASGLTALGIALLSLSLLRRQTLKEFSNPHGLVKGGARPLTGQTGGYLPFIDGLRSIAILLVVIYHFFPWAMPNGFVGVDVFFVISGFLITGIIMRDFDRGTFSFGFFYFKRARRLLPALACVLAATIAFGWLMLFRDEFAELGKHLAAAVGFISNIVLYFESGYFDTEAIYKPLLHLWPLGIEVLARVQK